MSRTLYSSLLIAVISWPVLAQTANTCGNDETIPKCFSRIAEAVTVDVAKEEMAEANTGVPTLTSPLASPLKDFLTMFAASVEAATLTENDQGGLTLDWNFGAKQFTSGRPFKLQTVFNKPQLQPKLKAALSGELLQQKEGSLDDTDDASVSLSYSPQNRSLGRALSPHRDLFDVLVHSAQDPVENLRTLLLVLQKFQSQAPFKGKASLDDVKISDLTKEQREKIEPAVIAAARQELAAGKAYQIALTAVGVEKFKKLLNQQPQAYGSLLARNRNELVGANELSFKLTYETSGRGLKSFYSAAKATCDDAKLKKAAKNSGSAEAEACIAAWLDFLADDTMQAALAGSGRFAFSLEYTGIDKNEVTIASPPSTVTPDPFTLKLDSSESLIGSFTYGLRVAGGGPGTREGRLDFTGSYENVTGDVNRDNRFVVSAVYSQKVSDTLTIPLGIVYANRDRYLKDIANRGVSMHFGLVYKLPKLGSK